MTEPLLQPPASRRVLRASIQSVGGACTAQLFLLVSSPLVARLLGVESRGSLAALYAFGIIATWVGTLGLPTACAYHISTNQEETRSVVRAATRLFLVQAPAVSALVAGVLLLWEHGKSAELDASLYPMLLLPPAILAHAYGLAVLQGLHRFLAYNVLSVLPVAIYASGVAALFVLDERSLLLVVFVWVGATVIGALATLTTALVCMPTTRDSSVPLTAKLLRFGVRAHLGHASPVATLPLDQAAVGAFLSPAALGLYTVAAGATNVLRFSSESIGAVAYPAMASLGRTREAWSLLWRLFLLVTASTALVAAMLFAAAPYLFSLVFGAGFAGSAPIARLLLVATALASSRRVLLDGLRGLGHPGAATLAEVAMYPWLAVATPFALVRYGGAGLAGALAVGYGISLAMALVVAVRLSADRRQPGLVPLPAVLPRVAQGPSR
jgi:O-antigen/teichoic acid export membrane protein